MPTTLKCTYGALACATWLVVVVAVRAESGWTDLLAIQFYVALLAGIALAIAGAAMAVSDRNLARSERRFAISVGVGTVIAVLFLLLLFIEDLSKLN
jgi:ABC-type Fe3+-siderophore transport system permease subunit